MTEHAQKEVVTKPTWQALLVLAGPMIISRSTQSVIGFTDAAMIGRLGESALAATTAGAMNVFILTVLPMGIVFVVQSFASQLTGKGDAQAARRYPWYGLVVAIATEVLCIASLPLLGAAVGLLPYSPEVQTLMVSYVGIRLLSGGPAIGLEAIGAYYAGLGNTVYPMCAQILVMVLNVLFAWVLIFGNLGAPTLAVEGAAIAAVLATSCGFLLLFALFFFGVGCSAKSTSGFSLREQLRLLRFGIPSGFNWFIEFAAYNFFINIIVAGLGTTAVAAFMTVMHINSVAFMPAFALSSAGAVFVGQAIGANKKDDVQHTLWLTMRIASGWMGLLALSYLFVPELFISVFMDESQVDAAHFKEVGARMLMLSCTWQLFDAAGMVLSEALRAAGDTAYTFWVRAGIAWLIFVPGTLVTVKLGGGEIHAMAWLILYLGLLAITLYLRFRSGRWRNIELTEEDVLA